MDPQEEASSMLYRLYSTLKTLACFFLPTIQEDDEPAGLNSSFELRSWKYASLLLAIYAKHCRCFKGVARGIVALSRFSRRFSGTCGL